MNEIHHLSWNSNSFIDKVKLLYLSYKKEKDKINSKNKIIKGEGYSNLSSTCYSIASTAQAQLKFSFCKAWHKLIIYPFTWLPLGSFCFIYMLILSNKAEKFLGDKISADQCDIRQSILRAWRMNKKALSFAKLGITKKEILPHTKSLLHLGIAEIMMPQDSSYAKIHVFIALAQADKVEKENPAQAIRIYRKAGTLYKKMGATIESVIYMKKAEKIIKNIKTKDQEIKSLSF